MSTPPLLQVVPKISRASSPHLELIVNNTDDVQYDYPSYYKIRPFEEQVKTFVDFFDLDNTLVQSNIANLPNLPKGAEGWFATPRWEKVGNTYSEAVKKMFHAMTKSRHLKNWCTPFANDYFRQEEKSAHMFADLVERQSGDIVFMPAQFGHNHKGKSAYDAIESFAPNEFNLGTFVTGCMLLAHPKREVMQEQLHIICGGDYVSDLFGDTPLFVWGEGKLHYGNSWADDQDKHFGLVSGFLPEEWMTKG